MKETLRQRIGVDVRRRVSRGEAVEWKAQNEVYNFDIQTDIATNALKSFDESRCIRIQEGCEKYGLHLGLHTLSGVNIAEISPHLQETADAYLRIYIDLSVKLGAE